MANTIPNETPPPATDFERRLNAEIASAYAAPSGTVWDRAAAFAAPELGLPVADVGFISVKDSGVINNRPLSAGLITQPRRFVVVVVDEEVGLDRQEAAIVSLIPKTRHLITVGLAAIADSGDGSGDRIWRLQRLIEIEGLGIGSHVSPNFPMVRGIRVVPLVPFPDRGTWQLVVKRGSGTDVGVWLPPGHPLLRALTPGDRVLLCGDDLAMAHGVGVIGALVDRDGGIQLSVKNVVWFAPVEVLP